MPDPFDAFRDIFGANMPTPIPADKRALVQGAIEAAQNDRHNTRDAKARHIADLFHVDVRAVEGMMAGASNA